MEIEKEFICDALPVALIGMNADMMSTYIEFVADRLLGALGAPKLYGATNPFDWMELISLQARVRNCVEFELHTGLFEDLNWQWTCLSLLPARLQSTLSSMDATIHTCDRLSVTVCYQRVAQLTVANHLHCRLANCAGQDQFLREARRRVPEGWRHELPAGQHAPVLPGCGLLNELNNTRVVGGRLLCWTSVRDV